MTLHALLRQLARAMERAGIPFMLTGSVAAAYHGAARATMDIDAVIDPTAAQLDILVETLVSVGLYVSAEAAHTALADRTMFNAIDPDTGWKADLIVRKQRPFSLEEFARRVPADLLGEHVFIATLEDVILSKLEWTALGGSARQLEDVRRLLAIAGETLDRAYVDEWAARLGVESAWSAVSAP